MDGDGLRWEAVHLACEPPFKIGGLSVQPAIRQVEWGGRRRTLEPRVMQVLVAFWQAGGEILTREALIARCWSGRIVGDNAIHQALSKVRELGAGLGGVFRIETIAKVGYRMIVEPASATADPEGAAEPEFSWGAHAEDLAAKTRRWLLGAAAVAATSGLAFLLIRTDPRAARVKALIDQSELAMRNDTLDGDASGVAFLEEAVRLQPSDALAWGKLALARQAVAQLDPPEGVAAAVAATQDAARRALALDSRQVDALAALAFLPPYYGDWAAAERRMRAVLAIDPGHVPTRDALDFMLVAVGRAREGAMDRLSFATREPLDAGQQYRLVYANWILGRIGDADRAAERALELWPRHPDTWFARLWVLAFTGRPGRALAHLEDAVARPEMPQSLVDVLRSSMIALNSRTTADATKAVDDLLRFVSQGPSASVSAILILNGLGEIDRAFEVAHAYLLEQGPLMASVSWRRGQVSDNDQHHRETNMLFVPVSAQMRADRRFLILADAMGLTRYWRQARVKPDFLQQ